MDLSRTNKIQAIIVPFFAFALTVTVYLTSLGNAFVTWDDDEYVYNNPYLHSLDFALIKWAFVNFTIANWHPLTWISYALDYSIWKLNPLGYHLTNLLLHGMNTFLVVLITLVLSKEGGGSSASLEKPLYFSGYAPAFISGLLFGLHPLHVESVAWISERKDVLCAFFFLASIYSYISYTKSVLFKNHVTLSTMLSNKNYLLTILLFVLALLSKPMAIMLPFVLLILDFYPLGRLSSLTLKSMLIEKVPVLFISIASSVITFLAQSSGGAVASFAKVQLVSRIFVAFKAIAVYIQKMFWPAPLLPFYPYPADVSSIGTLFVENLPYILFFITVSGFFLYLSLRKKQHLWLSAWCYYLITLLPVLGIIKIGAQSMADRYTYLPSIGPFMTFGIALTWLFDTAAAPLREDRARKVLFTVLVVLLFTPLSAVTLRQIGIWKNGEVLWNAEIKKKPEVDISYVNRGKYYFETNRFQEALSDFSRAIALDPLLPRNYFFRGTSFLYLARYDEALIDLTKAISLARKPTFRFYANRAFVLVKMNRFNDALKDYTRAIELNQESAEVYYNRGNLYARLGFYVEALNDFSNAIRLSPFPNYDYYHNRSVIYNRLGYNEYALRDSEEAMKLKGRSSPSSAIAGWDP